MRLVLDMDWHLDGWTGYTWNPKLLPDHKELLGLGSQAGVGHHAEMITPGRWCGQAGGVLRGLP